MYAGKPRNLSAILRFYLLIRYMLDFLEIINLPCRYLPRASWQAQTSHTRRRATYIAGSKGESNQLGTEVLTSFPDICSQPNLGQTCPNPEGPWDSRLSSLEILVPAGIQRLIHWSVIISRRATCERFKSQKLVLEVLSPIHAASLMAQGRRVPIPLIAYANNSASYAQCSAS